MYDKFTSKSIKCTGKSVSEALILESVNPQYDDRLIIELRGQYKKIVLECQNKNKKTIFVHNMFFTCSELAIF